MAKKKKAESEDPKPDQEPAPKAAQEPAPKKSSSDPTVDELFKVFGLEEQGIPKSDGLKVMAAKARKLAECDRSVYILATMMGVTNKIKD